MTVNIKRGPNCRQERGAPSAICCATFGQADSARASRTGTKEPLAWVLNDICCKCTDRLIASPFAPVTAQRAPAASPRTNNCFPKSLAGTLYLWQTSEIFHRSPSSSLSDRKKLRTQTHAANLLPPPSAYPVGCTVCLRVFYLHHNVGMEEIGGNHVRNKRSVFLLKDDCHNVVANVSFPLQLKV